MRWAVPNHSATLTISALYKRPLQVSRYLRQFPSPRSPNWSLLRQACRNSAHASLRTGRWQVSRYLRQFPSPRSPSTSLFSQARRNCSHSPPRTRTPPGPISTDWEKAETGITKRAAAAAAPNAHFRIPCNISDPPVGVGRSIETPLRRPLSRRGSGHSGRYRFSLPPPLVRADLHALHAGFHFGARPCVDYCAAWNLVPRPGTTSMGSLTFSSQMETLKGRYERRRNGQFRDRLFRAY